MTKHTPGPWKAEIDEQVPERGAVYVEGPQGWLNQAVADCGFNDVETDEANARLIAAAPELLEALQSLVASCEKHLAFRKPTNPVTRDRMAAARAAIAKAGA
jgi:hypothetical protein